MAKFRITNVYEGPELTKTEYNLASGEGVTEDLNPGAKTGPYAGVTFTDIAVPLPKTNFKVVLAKDAYFDVETEDTLEIEFFNALPGKLPVTVVPANDGE